MKVYYAHSLHLYNTPQEKRDIETLEKLGFKVFNPNCKKVQREYQKYKNNKKGLYLINAMGYFDKILDECDGIAFRAHIDGRIPSGVGYEIRYMRTKKKPIIELPSLIDEKFLLYEQTKQYLELNGQR